LVKRGLKAIEWIAKDKDLLKKANDRLTEFAGYAKKSNVFNVKDLIGVDEETFRKADAGDRQAQKRMLRNLKIKEASAKALTSGKPWPHFMLRMIGTCTVKPIADLMGVIDQQRKNNSLTAEESELLLLLLEQYMGPDEVDKLTMKNAIDGFSEKQYESAVLYLFLIYDQLSSGVRKVSLDKVEEAIALSNKVESAPARLYFESVWCQQMANSNRVPAALDKAWLVLEETKQLSFQDIEYEDRTGLIAYLTKQLCTILKDENGLLRLEKEYSRYLLQFVENSKREN